ncbi:patatin-like phospholipase family protein [Tabrizicola piscis]|uniref:patatin-like phospholipase family protein n=1 Tax=Tabrizicola piscis TaxID=2494374 RepID=UPI0013DE5743|nr:patatin-like phospholipase family protein [Tabrizicola piscis]
MPRETYAAADERDLSVAGVSGARIWADAGLPELAAAAARQDLAPPLTTAPVDILALSGGGSGGAFGAGLLVGWTERGDRPEFDVVTGVSAGALIAPFAFLGSEYDDELARAFSPAVTEPLNGGVTPLNLLFRNSIANNRALRALIDDAVTPRILAEITAAHRAGRRLFVMTANLDTQRPVVWDMGAIAAAGTEPSADLFKKVLLASASIPGYYPAVRIKVQTAAGSYDELHSDGGIFAQVFIGPDAIMLNPQLAGRGSANLYVIINNSLDPVFSVTTDSIVGVATRSYETFLKSHARATINATYLFATARKANFHLAYIDEDVPYDLREPFAEDYIDRVYHLGHGAGQSGTWSSRPPDGEG